MARLAGEAAAESEALSDSLSDKLKDALQQGKLTDGQLRELSKALGQCKALDREMLAKLVRAKLSTWPHWSVATRRGIVGGGVDRGPR